MNCGLNVNVERSQEPRVGSTIGSVGTAGTIVAMLVVGDASQFVAFMWGKRSPAASFEYILRTSPSCLRLFWHEARRADSPALRVTGKSIATKTPIMDTITTNSARVGMRDRAFTAPATSSGLSYGLSDKNSPPM